MSNQRENPFGKGQGSLKKGQVTAIAIGIFVIIFLLTGLYQVDQSEEAVVLRFGKYLDTKGPGLQFKAPFGIDRVNKVPVTINHSLQFGFRTISASQNTQYSKGDYSRESLMLTGDLNIANVTWIIQYKITDAKDWLFNFREKDRENTIRDVAQSSVNLLVGDRTMSEILSAERTNIEIEAEDLMEKTLDSYGMGVEIVTVKLQDVVPPAGPVQEAFEDVNKSNQDKDRYISEGREQYNSEVPKAEGTAEKIILEAEGYAVRRVNIANGDASRFNAVYDSYKANPTLMRDRLYWETMEEILSTTEAGTDVIDKELDNFLPLKNLSTGGAQ